MTPTRSKTAAAIAWFLFWTLMVLVALEDYRRDGGTAYWQPVLWETSSALVATFLLLARRLTARNDHRIATPWRWFALQARLLPLYWLAFVPLVFGIRHGVYALMGADYEHEAWPQIFIYESLKLTVFAGLFTVIAFGLLSYRELRGARLRAEQASALLREAQLQSLARQMQPHFLFNALNTVSSLMHTGVARADATLVQLADLLRAALALGERPQVTLGEELRLARAYAGVMEERFDGRARVDWRIDEALLGVALPAMSVQPLLESVFKHTVERRRDPTRITVSAACDGHDFVLRLEDDGGVLGKEAEGGTPDIGLANLRARLAGLHGAAASLSDLSGLYPAPDPDRGAGAWHAAAAHRPGCRSRTAGRADPDLSLSFGAFELTRRVAVLRPLFGLAPRRPAGAQAAPTAAPAAQPAGLQATG